MTTIEGNDKPPLMIILPHEDCTMLSVTLADGNADETPVSFYIGLPRETVASIVTTIRTAIEAGYATAYNTGCADTAGQLIDILGNDGVSAAIYRAEADSLTAHRMGQCNKLEWDCPHCATAGPGTSADAAT